jgi:hypothetical protein
VCDGHNHFYSKNKLTFLVLCLRKLHLPSFDFSVNEIQYAYANANNCRAYCALAQGEITDGGGHLHFALQTKSK